jgi:uncharacterized DUF497 family protein
MDVFFQLHGLLFVWRDEKAAINYTKHGVRFEQAAEIFLDPLLEYQDASVEEESRTAVIGTTFDWRLLFAVHIELEDGRIRIISARDVTAREDAKYQNRKGEL